MKICVIVEDHYRGGVQKVIKALIDDWFKSGFEIILISNVANPLFDDEITVAMISRAYKIKFLTSSKWVATSPTNTSVFISLFLKIASKLVKLFSLPFQVKYFRDLFTEIEVDVIFNVNGGYPGSLTSRAAAIGSSSSSAYQIMALHGLANKSRSLFLKIDNYVDSRVFRQVDKIITVSEICKMSFINRKNIALCSSQTVIRNAALNMHEFHTNSMNRIEDLGIKQDVFKYLMVGSYEHRKGHKFLLECFAEEFENIYDWHLICIGDDPNGMLSHLMADAVRLKISDRVTFLDFDSDLERLYRYCDVLVIPSQLPESSCLVAIEAISYGLPLIATNVGAMSETVPAGCGSILIDVDDAEGFINALVAIKNNKNLHKHLSIEAGKQAVQFSETEMVNSYRKEVLQCF